MFSTTLNNNQCKTPNQNINATDLAYPGAKPIVNLEAVNLALRACMIFKMKIDHELWFDRKSYYYFDLPKGYQITQFHRPIGKNGELEINYDLSQQKITQTIKIDRLHLEEDTAKQFRQDTNLLLDYNRCGIPLIEIVSAPTLTSPEAAVAYVKQIILLLKHYNICDAKLENGSMRCDINVSVGLSPDHFPPKVEIKNLNTLSNIKTAILCEQKLQINALNAHQKQTIGNITKFFNEKTKEVIFARVKDSNNDYHYILETNILPIRIPKPLITAQEVFIQENPLSITPSKIVSPLKTKSEKTSYQVLSPGVIDDFLNTVFVQSSDRLITNYLKSPELAINFLIGQVMKQYPKQFDPIAVKQYCQNFLVLKINQSKT